MDSYRGVANFIHDLQQDAYTEAPQAHWIMMQSCVQLLANLSTQIAADIVIMGDFNHPEIDWESVTREKNLNHSSQHFIDTIRYAYIRRQRVIVNGKLSSSADIRSGIPQGSV